jgi:phage terminase large subunit GpA-like protein
MNKNQRIQKSKDDFLNCDGDFLEKAKLAKIYLDIVKQSGSMNTILASDTWKENRKKKLKDCCETCGSTEGLHISHLWHPPRQQEMKKHVYEVYGEKTNQFRKHTVKQEKQCCPVCDGTNIKLLKTTGEFKCYAKKTQFIPEIQNELDIWENTKELEGVRQTYYDKYKVSDDIEVVFSIKGLKFEKVYCPDKIKQPEQYNDYLGYFKKFDLPLDDYYYRTSPTYQYYNNRHKVECNSTFQQANKKIVDKEINYQDTFRYYYALEHIALSARYMEMRDGDILTECRSCGFKRDEKVILEKKIS